MRRKGQARAKCSDLVISDLSLRHSSATPQLPAGHRAPGWLDIPRRTKLWKLRCLTALVRARSHQELPSWSCLSPGNGLQHLWGISAIPWGGPRTEQGWCSSARPSGGCRAAAPRGGVHGLGQPRSDQEQGPGNCPKGREKTEKNHKKQPGKSAGTPHLQTCAGGIGVGQVWSRSRWKSLLRAVPSPGLRISMDGTPTTPSQFPSQNHCSKPNTKDAKK